MMAGSFWISVYNRLYLFFRDTWTFVRLHKNQHFSDVGPSSLTNSQWNQAGESRHLVTGRKGYVLFVHILRYHEICLPTGIFLGWFSF